MSQEAMTWGVCGGFTRENYNPVSAYFRPELPGYYLARAQISSAGFTPRLVAVCCTKLCPSSHILASDFSLGG